MLRLQHVGAFRDSIINCFLSIKDEYSKIIYNKIDEDKTCLVDNIYFGYIPQEFRFANSIKLKDKELIFFYSIEEPECYISFEINTKGWEHSMNSESGEFTEYIEGDKDMIYSENDSVKLLYWQENNFFQILSTNGNKEDMLEMAKKIEIKEE